jgi:signal transduction histidine kinase
MSVAPDLRPLERRVSASYTVAFALVLAIFVVAVHVTFAADLAHETSARLAALLGEGRDALELRHGRVKIDGDAVQVIAPANESITWLAADGTPVRRAGLFYGARAGAATTAAASEAAPVFPIIDPRAPARIAVALDLAPSRRTLARVDLGLGIGLVVALAAAAIGGRILAGRAIARVAATVRTLRDFTADAAHELRGPLAALSSNAAASLRDERELGGAHRARLETIAQTAASMTRTIDDLLLLARAETPLERELFAVDLGERVSAVVEARRALAAERRIALEFEPFRARVYGNPSDIDRIVGNLLDNALRYTEPNGRVRVACVLEHAGVILSVLDSGIGIAEADLTRIFERFWRADGVRSRDGGTGLGLAIARALARRHGGDVSVRSRPGDGSEFALWLPLRPPTALHEISTFG